MDNPLADSVTATAVVVLVLKEMFVIIRSQLERRNGKSPEPVDELGRLEQEYLSPMRQQQDELHRWHDVTDADGVKIWYGRSLARPLEKLAEAGTEQTDLLKELLHVQRESLEATKRLK